MWGGGGITVKYYYIDIIIGAMQFDNFSLSFGKHIMSKFNLELFESINLVSPATASMVLRKTMS